MYQQETHVRIVSDGLCVFLIFCLQEKERERERKRGIERIRERQTKRKKDETIYDRSAHDFCVVRSVVGLMFNTLSLVLKMLYSTRMSMYWYFGSEAKGKICKVNDEKKCQRFISFCFTDIHNSFCLDKFFNIFPFWSTNNFLKNDFVNGLNKIIYYFNIKKI